MARTLALSVLVLVVVALSLLVGCSSTPQRPDRYDQSNGHWVLGDLAFDTAAASQVTDAPSEIWVVKDCQISLSRSDGSSAGRVKLTGTDDDDERALVFEGQASFADDGPSRQAIFAIDLPEDYHGAAWKMDLDLRIDETDHSLSGTATKDSSGGSGGGAWTWHGEAGVQGTWQPDAP